jgi:Superinfection immunity protein
MIHQSAAAAVGGGLPVGGMVLIVVIVLTIAVYWIPTTVAIIRRAANISSVAVVNALLGWTAIGWFVALAMAMRRPVRPTASV